jgi:hypothetical protein
VKVFRNFFAALRCAGKRFSGGVWWRGKGGSFVEQDKGPAVPYCIFSIFPNELAAFFSSGRS